MFIYNKEGNIVTDASKENLVLFSVTFLCRVEHPQITLIDLNCNINEMPPFVTWDDQCVLLYEKDIDPLANSKFYMWVWWYVSVIMPAPWKSLR